MKTGINMLLWTTFVDESFLPLIEKLQKTGFNGIEVPIMSGDLVHYKTLSKQIKNLGLECTASSVLMDEQHSAISPNPTYRKGAIDYLKSIIDRTNALGSPIVIGPLYQELCAFTGIGPTEDEKKWASDVHNEVGDYARSARVIVVLEPLNRFECHFMNTLDDAASYIKRVGHSHIKTMCDTFHSHIEEKDVVAAIVRNMDVLHHIHISENDRGTPGLGQIDFEAIISTLKLEGYDNWLTIESFGQALPELAAATRIWRPIFKSPEEVYTLGLQTINNCWNKSD